MTDLRKAAQQALEALETCDAAHPSDGGAQWYDVNAVDAAIATLQTALAQPDVPEGYKLLRDSTHDERSWPEDFNHENGCYHNTCVHCLRGFLGYKRRGICKVCAAPKGGA